MATFYYYTKRIFTNISQYHNTITQKLQCNIKCPWNEEQNRFRKFLLFRSVQSPCKWRL